MVNDSSVMSVDRVVLEHATDIIEKLRDQMQQHPDNRGWMVTTSASRTIAVSIADAVVTAMQGLAGAEGLARFITGVQVRMSRHDSNVSVITASVAQL